MGLILGGFILVAGIVGSLTIAYANDMHSAPNRKNEISILPWLITCSLLGTLFIFTHYHPISW